MADQLRLNLGRPRVSLKKVKVRLRVPRRVASAVAAASEEDTAAAMAVGMRKLRDEMCTRWDAKNEPPMPGLWEVTDHETGTVLATWWWNGKAWETPTGLITHQTFAVQYAWRGLKEKPAFPYECPPYTLQTLPAGCRLGNRKVNTLQEKDYPPPAFAA